MDFLDIEYQYQPRESLNYSSNIRDFDFNFETIHQVNMNLWPAGEDEAETRLLKFLDEKVVDYSKNRNDPILDGTSRISPYLATGIISSKKCILEASKIHFFDEIIPVAKYGEILLVPSKIGSFLFFE